MFDVEKVLQSSGMTLEEPLSIKDDHAVLRVQRADTGSFILRLYRKEVPAYRALEKAWCEGFPQVYRTYEEEGFFVVEEEDVEGISLEVYLKQAGTLPEKEALELMLQLCSSLQSLHSLGYIHRDVKPEHILLTPEKKAVLIDLDASMLVQPEKKNDTMLIGTVLYAAPEQFGLTRSDVRSDIYALGILLNEMVTGKHPTVMQYRKGRLAKIIETCTKINPEDRYQSVEELETALTHAAKSLQPALLFCLRDKKVLAATVCMLVLMVSATGWLWGNDIWRPAAGGEAAAETDAFYGYTVSSEGNYQKMVNLGANQYQDGCPQFYASNNGSGKNDFYILYPAEDNEKEVPELKLFQVEGGTNQYVKDIPDGKSGISVSYQKKQKVGDQKCHVWKLTVGDGFGMAKTGITLSAVPDYQYILWVLGENYQPADTSTFYDGIYAVSDVPKEGWDSLEDMMESGSCWEEFYGEDTWAGINLNLSEEPDSKRNTFYILQQKGMDARITLTRLHGFILSEGSAMLGADCMFEEVLSAEEMLEVGQPMEVRIGNAEYEAVPVNLKKHIGRNDLYLTIENDKSQSMRAKITFGMDVCIEGEIDGVEYAGPGYNAEQRIFGFDPLTPDFEFTRQEDGTYRGYFSNACGRFSDFGQGMVASLFLQLKPGYTAAEIHDGKELYTYCIENCCYYDVFDQNGDFLDTREKLMDAGWATIVRSSQNEVEKIAAAAGRVTAENGMSHLKGADSLSNFERFLEESGCTAKEMGRFTDCVVYFDGEKTAEQTKIVFHIEKQEDETLSEEQAQPQPQPTDLPAMEDAWMQMYKYDWMEPVSYMYRTGGQSARYYTEEGELIDRSYKVYADKEVGKVIEWDPAERAWLFSSEGCDAGASGYLHAEKGGEHFVIYVEVLGEPMSAYTQVPDWLDFMAGYLQTEAVPGVAGGYVVEYTYERDKPLTLYLAAMHGMEKLDVLCKSPLVSIELYEGEANWQGPIYALTFENPEGGDVIFEVASNMNRLTFSLNEK